jgi:acyl-CoA reductase-like NAD-dependent aldehyde dehydrogenase
VATEVKSRPSTVVKTPIGKKKMLIGGQLVESVSGRWLESINPATEEYLGEVPRGDKADVDLAYKAAAKAQPAWAALAPSKRADYLRKLADALEARGEEALHIEVLDTGNTIAKMRFDLGSGCETLRFYAGIAYEMKGQTIPASPGNLHLTVREPFGVVGRIIPFNHPLMFSIAKMAAPLMAGNTVIVKPSEQSPLSASILAEECARVLPPGVVNIVTGLGMEAGDAIVRHPNIKRLAFTGSAKTGMAIQKAAAEVAIKVFSLELGGKNPMIVFPDVDVDKAVAGAIAGMNFAWQGQSCGSTSRLFLHESIHDAVLEKLVKKVSSLKLGEPLDETSEMGPINSKAQYEKVTYYIKAGQEDGAKLMTGGKRPSGDYFKKGFWVEPTVFANVTPDMRIAREEIFGPVLSVFKWKDIDQCLEAANSVEYGLTGAVWTNNLQTAIKTAMRVQSGYVWINGTSAHFKGTPFGGFRNSGIGREEATDELHSYTEEKSIHIMLG